jgi:putative IMPACT (imprinted ancient) family translation regulator
VASSCIQQSSIIQFIPNATVKCSVLLSSLGSFYHIINRFEGSLVVNEEFGADRVEVEISLPEDKVEMFEKTFRAQFVRTACAEGEFK